MFPDGKLELTKKFPQILVWLFVSSKQDVFWKKNTCNSCFIWPIHSTKLYISLNPALIPADSGQTLHDQSITGGLYIKDQRPSRSLGPFLTLNTFWLFISLKKPNLLKIVFKETSKEAKMRIENEMVLNIKLIKPNNVLSLSNYDVDDVYNCYTLETLSRL